MEKLTYKALVTPTPSDFTANNPGNIDTKLGNIDTAVALALNLIEKYLQGRDFTLWT